jgi:hypothetical protein
MILMVGGAHHEEGHQKQKLHEKNLLRGNLSCQKWLLCILPLWQHHPKLWHQQLKRTLTLTFSSWMISVR